MGLQLGMKVTTGKYSGFFVLFYFEFLYPKKTKEKVTLMEAESQATNVRYQNNYVLRSESFLWLLMTTAISASRDPLDFFVLQLQAIITQLKAFSVLSKEYVVYRYDNKSFLLFATRLWNEGCDSRRPISHVIDSLPTEIKEKRAMKYRRWTHFTYLDFDKLDLQCESPSTR